ncbi:DUF2785 domain-containing protein [Bacillus salacetis]|uniref:DUF2785 domain-containing protein n=1 Tax=Bacillus salacetis TaxID=2315464 RepID=UPI003BA015FA
MDLKEKLQEFKNNNFENKDNIEGVLVKMMENIGHPDPELRDQLIYTTFYRWIEKDILTKDQLQSLLKTSIDENHLFYKIGERFTDSVFTRSFSSLAAALVIRKDTEAPSLPKELISEGIKSSIRYLVEERDTRGYVQGKGWAHSIAHGADLLAASINHPAFEKNLIPACLEAIEACYEKEAVYMDDEDERLIFAVEALLKNGLSKQELMTWLENMNRNLKTSYEDSGFSVPFFRRKKNFLDFLKSLFFRVGCLDGYKDVQEEISSILEKWHHTLYTP